MTARASDPTETKDFWRRRVLAARRALAADARAARDAALCAATVAVVRGGWEPDGLPTWGPVPPGGIVCVYQPIGTEPGGPALPDALAQTGVTVLLPVVPAAAGPLDWARHDGRFEAGPLGLRQPAGPRCGPAAVADAALVLVPALAADRSGVRLGRGGGYYDRTLTLATGPVVAVLGEGELVHRLPAEPHDRPVVAALLPGGLVTLGKTL